MSIDSGEAAGTSNGAQGAQGGSGAVGTTGLQVSSVPPAAHSAEIGDNNTQALIAQARATDDHFTYDNERVVVNPPNWDFQKSEQLYNSATQHNDPATAESASQSWVAHSTELEEIANDLYNAITELGSVWVGQGAGAAQGALVSIAKSGSQAGAAARVMGERMSQQASVAAEVKKMPPPVDFDQKQATAALLAGGPAALTADMKAQYEHAREVKREQVRYFNAYTAAMQNIDSSTPSFGPESLGLTPTVGTTAAATAPVGSAGVPPAGAQEIDTSGLVASKAGAVAAAPVTQAPAGLGGSVSGPAPVSVDASDGAPQTQAQPQGQVQTSSAGLAPAPASGAAPVAPASASAPAPSTSTGGSSAFTGGAALGAGLAAAAGGKLASGARSGSTRDEDAFDGDAEADELDTVESDDGETDVAAGHTSGLSSFFPSQSGFVPSGGTLGSSGHAPVGGAPVAGAGAGGQSDEEEHSHASFLIESDPDDLFGADQATPPPVIGAWTEDDDS